MGTSSLSIIPWLSASCTFRVSASSRKEESSSPLLSLAADTLPFSAAAGEDEPLCCSSAHPRAALSSATAKVPARRAGRMHVRARVIGGEREHRDRRKK